MRTPYWNRWRNWLVSIWSTSQDQRSSQEAWKDRRPPGRNPFAISPTFEWVVIWRSSEINRNFQRNLKRSVDLIFVKFTWPPHPNISPPPEKELVHPNRPVRWNVKLKLRVLYCGLHLQVSGFDFREIYLAPAPQHFSATGKGIGPPQSPR